MGGGVRGEGVVHLVTVFTFRYRSGVVLCGCVVLVEDEDYGSGEDDDDGHKQPYQ